MTTGILKALSIRQPWAWAITQGPKRIENRSWRTNYRGPLLLHASKGRTGFASARNDLNATLAQHFGNIPVPEFDALPRGAIVGIADLVDCVDVTTRPELADDPFADCGSFWWLLDNVRAFDAPITHAGSLNLFGVPRRVVAHVL